ncbi:MAG: DUF899 domain-containing protein [Alphaproteobacteria bacterium]|nr:DUF899 domain-containing protein [Alphaproteobacteria bacterium]MCW5742646.1 DUF899 domain-containing protein [Alphaproteobacteria bacterium]
MTRTVDRGDWLDARRALLRKEKDLTRLRDEVAALRRALPRVRIDKDYVFAGPSGPVSLGALFAGRSQLIVYHFMLGPDWNEPCKSCSFWAEHHDATRVHLAHRDVELAAVSRAPVEKIERFKQRFGWRFPWVSSLGSDFNFDFAVSFPPDDGRPRQPNYNFGTQTFGGGEAPGLSVFMRDADGAIFHTYSTYSRGLDALNGTYQLLDLVPKGRDEEGLDFPMAWVRLKDRYDPT